MTIEAMVVSSFIGPKAVRLVLTKVFLLASLVALCKGHRRAELVQEEFFESTVDHFNFAENRTFKQRFFTSLPGPLSRFRDFSQPKVLFFYTGNEADVELYVNATGLMWENREKFNAMLVFAEHRYYGKSWPIDGSEKKSLQHVQYLTSRQALMDYVKLLDYLYTKGLDESIPVIAFGGSYGGMLCAWMRGSFPNYVDGCIAGSAPVLAFKGVLANPINRNNYWRIVSDNFRNASRSGPASSSCSGRIAEAFNTLSSAHSQELRAKLVDGLHLCPSAKAQIAASREKLTTFALYLVMGFDNLAMGNYPYPSSYLTGDGNVKLPAYPIKHTCKVIEGAIGTSLQAVVQGALVFYNASKDLKCIELPEDNSFDGIWDAQVCSEFLPQETYFPLNGVQDIFFNYSVSFDQLKHKCQRKFKLTPREDYIGSITKGMFQPFKKGGRRSCPSASKILFTNGEYDPWRFGGVIKSAQECEIYTQYIEQGAHHLDLFYSHPDDPASVRHARSFAMKLVKSWIREAYAKYQVAQYAMNKRSSII